jgi:LAO/AO transport system kinase
MICYLGGSGRMKLVDEMLRGDASCLARLITLVEMGGKEVPEIMKLIHPYTGKAYRIGVTGPPGAGKSTLVDKLTALLRRQGAEVGIIAVDPTSPFTGGAVLGDRIRMQQHYLDEGVFIRSMATRGSLGGLPETTAEVSKLLDASGKEYILIETVGVGQTEIDVIKNADTVIVTLAPGFGDAVQTMKAGLFEIADIFAVNKADLPGADNLMTDIHAMLLLRSDDGVWKTPMVRTEAVSDVGTEELFEQIEKHRKTLTETGELERERHQQLYDEFMAIVQRRIAKHLRSFIEQDTELSGYMDRILNNEIDPYSAAEEILSSPSLLTSWCFALAKSKET